MITDPRGGGQLCRPQVGTMPPLPNFAPVYAPALGRAPMHATDRRHTLLAHPEPSGPTTRYRFDITLQGNDETVFVLI